MKKIAFYAMAAALLCLTVACSEKEGTYNPSKKISKIYRSSSYIYGYSYDGETWEYDTNITAKHLVETWTWDGKKLQSITDEDGGVIKFTYDGNKVVSAASDEVRAEFTYDGKYLQKLDIYEQPSTTPVLSYSFTRTDKKITTITMNMDYNDFGLDNFKSTNPVMRMQRIVMREIMPNEQAVRQIENATYKTAAKANTKESIPITLNLTWDGDNISRISASVMMMLASTMDFTYDKMNNPYQGFFLTLAYISATESMVEFGNKNNVTKVVTKGGMLDLKDEDDDTYTRVFTYTYDGKWPVECNENEESSDEYNMSKYSSVTYFEYTK